jgi:hypothetical protein
MDRTQRLVFSRRLGGKHQYIEKTVLLLLNAKIAPIQPVGYTRLLLE